MDEILAGLALVDHVNVGAGGPPFGFQSWPKIIIGRGPCPGSGKRPHHLLAWQTSLDPDHATCQIMSLEGGGLLEDERQVF